MEEKTIFITGSTDGIGKQTALELAQKGHRILIHGKDKAKGESTLEEIKKSSSNEKIELYIADFSSLKQVRQLASDIQKDHDSVDVLINNAGVYSNKKVITEDNLELTFQVNYLSHFLLTIQLLPLIKKSSPSRIINVSSVTHQSADFDMDNLQGELKYSGYNAYAISKLCDFAYNQKERSMLWDLSLELTGISEPPV